MRGQNLENLSGKVIVITGCAGLLGKAICKYLHNQNCQVVGLDTAEDFSDQCLICEHSVGKHTPKYMRVDITDHAAMTAAKDAIIDSIGIPWGLVNMAALDAPPGDDATVNGPLETIEIENFRKVIDVNVTGAFIAAQVFGGAMAKTGGGSIVFSGSVYGQVSPRQGIYQYRRDKGENFYKPAAYSVSKSALLNLTKYLATYWSKDSVRVNTLVLAGVFNNQDEEFLSGYLEHVPLGRMAEIDDITGAISFMLSQASSYMTGTSLIIDGGYTSW
jgi:NAD(P)-dependent dehydrogenase (short-subunit alcohol dehydrogenase family)